MSGALIETDARKIRDERDREKTMAMLRKGKTPEEIADFCDYPLELVLKVKESMKEAVAV